MSAHVDFGPFCSSICDPLVPISTTTPVFTTATTIVTTPTATAKAGTATRDLEYAVRPSSKQMAPSSEPEPTYKSTKSLAGETIRQRPSFQTPTALFLPPMVESLPTSTPPPPKEKRCFFPIFTCLPVRLYFGI
ncbi:unnamed protein product [Protopolystoma xenopodis]|uniref:Uncharacterized protein n=1 Tax=Protopolystoma xenopodis TaxID=117903 RepID=A0A448WFV6_9PLAT|nr:unnamed protein product [Protopolystoma xenopodis]